MHDGESPMTGESAIGLAPPDLGLGAGSGSR